MTRKILLLFIFSLPAIGSLLIPGFFYTHDGAFHLIRLYEFDKVFKSGVFPVRWAPDLNFGYGYPIFNFFYPLPYWLGEIFHLLGLSYGDSLKILTATTLPLSAVFVFLWTRKIWGEWGGFLSGLFYLWAPYRFLTIYVSGNFGEALGFIFVPLIFWSIWELGQKPQWKFVILGGVSFAGLILSHNVLVFIFSPIVFLYGVFQTLIYKKKLLAISNLFLSMFFGFSLSSFFWLPAIIEAKYVLLSQNAAADFVDHFPTLSQLIYSRWGYGTSVKGPADLLSFQIGLAQLLVVFLSLFVLVFRRKQMGSRIKEVVFSLFCFAVSCFFMNETSALFWRTIPGMTNIQYPWRLLAVTTFSTAFLAGSAVYLFRSKVLVLFLVLLVLYANRNHLRPADPFRHDDLFYLQNPALSSGTTDIAHENMPIWVKNWPATWSMARVEITKGQATISGEKFLPIGSSFTIEASQEAKIRINTLYFPGWQILVDGRKQSIDFQNEKGVMEIRIQAGIHQVETKFTDTPVRQLGNSLSLISFFGLLSWGIWKGKGLMLKLKG